MRGHCYSPYNTPPVIASAARPNASTLLIKAREAWFVNSPSNSSLSYLLLFLPPVPCALCPNLCLFFKANEEPRKLPYVEFQNSAVCFTPRFNHKKLCLRSALCFSKRAIMQKSKQKPKVSNLIGSLSHKELALLKCYEQK